MEKFYLGLDIGTDSVGIACTDESYRLLRSKGKDLWAVRLFDEANDASERRAQRTTRRRTDRRRQRIGLLREVFAPFLEDPTFFLRLNNSGFYEEDKAEGLAARFSLFADPGYTDKEFYAEYPTIFHLRKRLMDAGAKDLRLYYLAIHHIVKYRGHFLFDGETDARQSVGELFRAFNEVSADRFDEPIVLDEACAERFSELARDGKQKLNDKKRAAAEMFGGDARVKEATGLLLGGKGKPSVLFGEEYREEKSLSLDVPDEEFAALEETYGDDFPILEKLRAIYNEIRLEKVLGGAETVSDAMVGIYNTHRDDLRDLKKLLLLYSHDLYAEVLKSTKQTANYVNYIGYTKSNGKKIRVDKCKDREAFLKYLKQKIASPLGDEEGEALRLSVLGRIESGEFLPKILNADNGLFPHQINRIELDKILASLCRDFPAFAERDGDGPTPAEKIRMIFLFRIPYYVGPLNQKSEHAWVERAAGRITPWNFDEKVDKEASNEKFIRQMTAKCTYLHAEDVLPKGSMYYQAFDTLNQLNKLRLNDEPISVGLKQELFRELFLKDPRVTDKKIVGYLLDHGYAKRGEKVQLSGKDGEIKANMRTYIAFSKKLGAFADERPDVLENIVLWHTLSPDKSMVERLILKNYGDIPIVCENLKWLKSLAQFRDFGRLSLKFLTQLSGGEDPVTELPKTILGELYRTNDNLNELLFGDGYSFREAIAAENGAGGETVGYKDVEELYVAPQVRRGIWQALRMTEEYVAALGRAPDKIFVEVTRQEEKEKTRKESRQERLLALYRDAKDLGCFSAELEGKLADEKTKSEIRQERVYLYYRQLGRCMYTGEPIDLAALGSNRYDVDHVIPQSLVKDDSFDNKVLVLRSKNAEKTDRYPLPEGFTDQQHFWKVLLDKNLISPTLYSRLTRKNELTDDDFREFVNRQLVYTNQMAKAAAELLRKKYPESEVVYSKAANVSDFRQKFKFVKCRETNDLHHARDAYLNIVVGNVFHTRFTSLHEYFYHRDSDDTQREIKLDSLFFYNVKGAWDAKTSIGVVRKTLGRFSMSVTRYPLTEHGAFYNQTVYPKASDEGPRKKYALNAPRKGTGPLRDAEKYGGYTSLSTAYFAVVRSKGKKGALQTTVEAVPVLVDYRLHGDAKGLEEYFRVERGLDSPEIVVPKLRIKSLLKIDGFPVYLAGITGNRLILHNAVEWFADAKTDAYVKALGKLSERDKKGEYSDEDKKSEYFPVHANRLGEVKLAVDREQNEELFDKMLSQIEKPIYNGISGAVAFRGTLEKHREDFSALSVWDQKTVLLQIARFLKCNAENADLTLLKEGAGCGSLKINVNITGKDVRIVHTSPCGLHVVEQRI